MLCSGVSTRPALAGPSTSRASTVGATAAGSRASSASSARASRAWTREQPDVCSSLSPQAALLRGLACLGSAPSDGAVARAQDGARGDRARPQVALHPSRRRHRCAGSRSPRHARRAAGHSPTRAHTQAIAVIENCCLDIKGKALGVTVATLLGGPMRDRLPVYWSHCGNCRLRHHDIVGCARALGLGSLTLALPLTLRRCCQRRRSATWTTCARSARRWRPRASRA